MITNPKAQADMLSVIEKLHRNTDSISALITPTIVDKKWLIALKKAGTEMVGIAIDAATPNLFAEVRGQGVHGPHRWDKYWQTVEQAVDVFGKFNVGIHLIVGLGETEEEMVNAIQKAHSMGVKTHLFSFYPEIGSPLQDAKQPPIGAYRRIQLARYLINNDVVSSRLMKYDEDYRITDFAIRGIPLERIIDSGFPFLTSGCPGATMVNACNRPFANCTPYQASTGEIRNFPYSPDKNDLEIVKTQLYDRSKR
jgi:biotin synthase